jgi:MYXO-CTERM domain-containing protein
VAPSPDAGVPPQADSGGTPNDTTPPKVVISSPSANALVPAQTQVVVQATDDGTIAKVELRVDNALAATRSAPPYTFPIALKPGTHLLEAKAVDGAGNVGKASVLVTVQGTTPPADAGGPAPPPPADSGAPAPQQPDAGVPGAKQDSGSQQGPAPFGSPCAAPAQCASGLCVHDPTLGATYCSQQCSPGGTPCPVGSTCLSAGATGYLCGLASFDPNNPQNPGSPDADVTAGCRVGADAPLAGSTLALALLALLGLAFRRRR